MADSKENIIKDISEYIQESGIKKWFAWYVGISKDARNRLFNEHGVSEDGDGWIYCQANSSNAAREVEDYFVNTLGTDGGTGGGDDESDMVYAYRKENHTNP